MIFLTLFWIQFASIVLRILLMFFREFSLGFSFLAMSLLRLVIRLILTFDSVFFPSTLYKCLRIICIQSSLKIWWKSAVDSTAKDLLLWDFFFNLIADYSKLFIVLNLILVSHLRTEIIHFFLGCPPFLKYKHSKCYLLGFIAVMF